MKKTLLVLTLLFVGLYACKKDEACCDEVCNVAGTPSADLQWVLDNTTPYDYGQLPTYVPAPTAPKDNPTTVEGVLLGRHLFYDPILSGDNTLSCAGCHKQQDAFTDLRKFSEGIDGSLGTRQSMALFNMDFGADGFSWDGSAKTIEQQVVEPVANPIEMHEDWANAIAEIEATDLYPDLYANAFGPGDITVERSAKAIAQFLRTIVSFNSKFDKSITPGTGISLTEQEERGKLVYEGETGQCFHCHSAGVGIFTDGRFSNNGLDYAETINDFPDPGLGARTGNDEDYGKFKIPSLRNIELTPPYMHDGRFETLEEVVDFYSEEIQFSPNRDPIMVAEFPNGIFLSDEDKVDLIAYLKTLSDYEFIVDERYSNPFE